MAGVVKTTSPIIAQPDQQDVHRDRDYGSIVASSISITGMSSLIG